jgi:hypothetical protein
LSIISRIFFVGFASESQTRNKLLIKKVFRTSTSVQDLDSHTIDNKGKEVRGSEVFAALCLVGSEQATQFTSVR